MRSPNHADRTGGLVDLEALVTAAQDGDREAFDELVRRTFVDTFTLAHRLTGHEEDALDVVQETYLRAWKGIDGFRGDAQLTTWLYRITANTASTHSRRRRRQRAELVEHAADAVDERAESQPAVVAESTDTLDRLGRALETLPAKLRTVVVLKDVYGLPHEAIAEELGISVSAAKVRLHRGRRRLRDVVDEREVRARAV